MAILRITLDRKTMKEISRQVIPGQSPNMEQFIDDWTDELARSFVLKNETEEDKS